MTRKREREKKNDTHNLGVLIKIVKHFGTFFLFFTIVLLFLYDPISLKFCYLYRKLHFRSFVFHPTSSPTISHSPSLLWWVVKVLFFKPSSAVADGGHVCMCFSFVYGGCVQMGLLAFSLIKLGKKFLLKKLLKLVSVTKKDRSGLKFLEKKIFRV